MRGIGTTLDVINWVVLVYFILLNTFYLLTSLLAFGALRNYARRLKGVITEDLIGAAAAPPITMIAPAYNEELGVVESVRSLLTQKYPDFEIIVVNDGSKDATFERLSEAFDLELTPRVPTAVLSYAPVKSVYRSRRSPNVWVVDKVNGGGKADALNAGLAYTRTPLVCALDADTILERDALTRVVRPFLEDARTMATGGIIRIVNGCTVKNGVITDVRLPRNILARYQVLEYLRAFLAGRMGWGALKATLIISGAFGLFRREPVVEVGGFRTDTVGEDMEMIVRLHRHFRTRDIPYEINYVPDPVAWTEAPTTFRVLARQRDRWQRGLAETLIRHRGMLFNRRYGVLGMVGFPYFFFLEMMGPAVEAAGYVTFTLAAVAGRVNWVFALAFFLVAFWWGAVLSIAAVGLEELTFRRYTRVRDLVRLMVLALLEPFFYRLLQTFWRARGMMRTMLGRKGWGEMSKKGFASEAA